MLIEVCIIGDLKRSPFGAPNFSLLLTSPRLTPFWSSIEGFRRMEAMVWKSPQPPDYTNRTQRDRPDQSGVRHTTLSRVPYLSVINLRWRSLPLP